MPRRWTDEDRERMRARAAATRVPAARRRTRARPEDQLQRSVVQAWAILYPDTWRATMHCPSGIAVKTPRLAAIFKGLGWKPGFPDLACYAPRGPFAGLALELKVGTNTTSDTQVEWLEVLKAALWRVAVVRTLDEALAILDAYHDPRA
jgi:hypothetical protein